MRLLKSFTACLLLLATPACFGKFPLTRMVYKFNDSLGNKFVETIVFWVFIILPVYGIAGFVDAVVFNLVAFWTGNEILESQHVQLQNGGDATLTRVSHDVVRIRRTSGGRLIDEVEFVRVSDRAGFARCTDGTLLVSGELLEDGTLVVRQGESVRRVSSAALDSLSASAPDSVVAEAAQLFEGAALASAR